MANIEERMAGMEEGKGMAGETGGSATLPYNPDGTIRAYTDIPVIEDTLEPGPKLTEAEAELLRIAGAGLEPYCPDGVHLRCTHVFEEGHEKEGTQCTQWATSRSAKRGGPNLCDMHGGGGGAPKFPEMPDLLGNIRQVDEWLDMYKGMKPTDFEPKVIEKFVKLQRTKGALFAEWRKYEAGIWKRVKEYVAEERDHYIGKVLELIRDHVRDTRTLSALKDGIRDLLEGSEGQHQR